MKTRSLLTALLTSLLLPLSAPAPAGAAELPPFTARFEKDADGVWLVYPSIAGCHYRIESGSTAAEADFTMVPGSYRYGTGQELRWWIAAPPPPVVPPDPPPPPRPVHTLHVNLFVATDAAGPVVDVFRTHPEHPWSARVNLVLPVRTFNVPFLGVGNSPEEFWSLGGFARFLPLAEFENPAAPPAFAQGSVEEEEYLWLLAHWQELVSQLTPPEAGIPADPPPAPEGSPLPDLSLRSFVRVQRVDVDTNSNGFPDWWELQHNYQPFVGVNSPGFINPTGDDDFDGLNNGDEFSYGTNPREADTDGDLCPDGMEIDHGGDPNNATSTPDLLVSINRSVSCSWDVLSGNNYFHWLFGSHTANRGAQPPPPANSEMATYYENPLPGEPVNVGPPPYAALNDILAGAPNLPAAVGLTLPLTPPIWARFSGKFAAIQPPPRLDELPFPYLAYIKFATEESDTIATNRPLVAGMIDEAAAEPRDQLQFRRIWLRGHQAPPGGYSQTYILRKERFTGYSYYDGTLEPGTEYTVTYEPVTFTVPEGERISNFVDLTPDFDNEESPPLPFRFSALRWDLLPIELKDIKGNGAQDDQIIESMAPLPTQNQGEVDQVFWQRQNAYFQQQVSDQSIAYIEPHRNANNSPDMPRLVAKLLNGPAGINVKWRLTIEYMRGNGYRADYVENFTRPEDTIITPAAGADGNPTFTAEMNSTAEWRIFESQAWLNEIQQRGFFGGTGKLYLMLQGEQAASDKPVITFRIGGVNPDQQLARNYINQSAGAQFWYAYAMARHETFGRVRVNGQIRYYNQFYTNYQGGPIGDASIDMGWAAWAKGWPLYNLDRYRGANGQRHQNGPGGYGLYQLTWGPKHPNDVQGAGADAFIPRRMIWNWQDNANGAVTELLGKVPAATALSNALQAAYPQWPALADEGHLSGLEAIVVTLYNGTAGLPLRNINGSNRRTPWTAELTGQTRSWQFHQNSQNYVQSVNDRINNTIP